MSYFDELREALTHIDIAPLLSFVQRCQGTLWLAGNGGSAATAQHWACDLSKAAGRRAIALGSNPAVLTAYSNDRSYDSAFAQEFQSLVQPDDALICLSCSGTSLNIAMLLRLARLEHIPTALITSTHYVGLGPDVTLHIPHTHYGIIEDCHLAIGHALTEALCNR